MASDSRNVLMKAIQVVLAIIIVVLGYILYESITEPYKEVERQKQLTQLTRQRMSQLRSLLVYYHTGLRRSARPEASLCRSCPYRLWLPVASAGRY